MQSVSVEILRVQFLDNFLPRDASAERGNATVSCPSVCNV